MEIKSGRCIMPSTCFCVFSACVIVNFLGYQHHIKTHWNNQKHKLNFDLKLCFGGIWIVEQKVSQTSAISALLTPLPLPLKLGPLKVHTFPSGMNEFLNTQLFVGPLNKLKSSDVSISFFFLDFCFKWREYRELTQHRSCCTAVE